MDVARLSRFCSALEDPRVFESVCTDSCWDRLRKKILNCIDTHGDAIQDAHVDALIDDIYDDFNDYLSARFAEHDVHRGGGYRADGEYAATTPQRADAIGNENRFHIDRLNKNLANLRKRLQEIGAAGNSSDEGSDAKRRP